MKEGRTRVSGPTLGDELDALDERSVERVGEKLAVGQAGDGTRARERGTVVLAGESRSVACEGRAYAGDGATIECSG